MYQRLANLQASLPEEYKRDHGEMFKYVEHTLKALDKMVEAHNQLVRIEAWSGGKPHKEEEMGYHQAIKEVKRALFAELEKTLQDYEHRGDKHWSKYYKDGIM